MVDKIFIFGKDMSDYMDAHNIVRTWGLENQQVQISDWETLSLGEQTALRTGFTALGYVET